MSRILVRTLLGVVASTILGGQAVQAQLTKQLPESEKKATTTPAKSVVEPKLTPLFPSPFQPGYVPPPPSWTSPKLSLTKPFGQSDLDLLLSGKHAWSLPTPTKPILDLTKFPEERLMVAKMKDFPNLGTDFEVVAPRTGHPDFPQSQKPGVKQYNCIAWTLGITDHWVWPGKTVREFDALYARHGFKRAATRNLKHEPGVVKVALYGLLDDAGNLGATHAARQEADGTWTSKLGGEARIRHLTAEAVAGPGYGDPIAVYVKKP